MFPSRHPALSCEHGGSGRVFSAVGGAEFAFTQQTPTYFTQGGSLTLDLRTPPSERITNILWQFSRNLLAEWGGNMFDLYYYRNKTTTTLDTSTGRLIINDMTKDEEGLYSVEINKVQSDTFKAVMIKHVPKPEVWR
ncbi:hypothetical protein F7725_023715 [Dissostichus mawsoni]|uniref:Immunoglobulin V-set domain-containing protein n=1 Tax=Dissostichus mawsoni TaxID=36200 RepID=A0A7J5XXB8_DISMA|nr:hypothetical protein F7725_023715 [Dissostichus mawsoni]